MFHPPGNAESGAVVVHRAARLRVCEQDANHCLPLKRHGAWVRAVLKQHNSSAAQRQQDMSTFRRYPSLRSLEAMQSSLSLQR